MIPFTNNNIKKETKINTQVKQEEHEIFLQRLKEREEIIRKNHSWKNIRTTPEEAIEYVQKLISEKKLILIKFPKHNQKNFNQFNVQLNFHQHYEKQSLE